MPIYAYSTDVTVSDDGTVVDMQSGDDLYIAQGATLLSLYGNAVKGTQYVSVNVAGDLYGGSCGILMTDPQGPATIQVARTGNVTGRSSGIECDGNNNILNNHGDISSSLGSGVFFIGGGGTVFNDGSINGAFDALSMGGGDANLVVNGGSIFAPRYAIVTWDAADTIINKGLISGDVFLGPGDDTFDTSGGRIVGVILLEDGNDTMIGGAAGGETVDGGDGDDDIDGGGGVDTFVYSGINPIVIDLGAGTTFNLVDHDTLENIENATTTGGNDRITGSILGNVLVAGTGNDGLAGIDGNDRLFGQAGADTLAGGNGRDIMAGGTEKDVFDVNAIAESKLGAGADIIRDFVHLSDKIDLSTIDANSVAAGNQAFSFLPVQGAAFTGVAGQLHYVFSQGFTYVEGDVNGDKAADFRIALVGFIPLTSGDFAL